MPGIAWALIIAGFVIGFGAFIFAILNMVCGRISNTNSFGNMFKRHAVALIAMAFGAMLIIAGTLIGGAGIVNRILQ